MSLSMIDKISAAYDVESRGRRHYGAAHRKTSLFGSETEPENERGLKNMPSNCIVSDNTNKPDKKLGSWSTTSNDYGGAEQNIAGPTAKLIIQQSTPNVACDEYTAGVPQLLSKKKEGIDEIAGFSLPKAKENYSFNDYPLDEPKNNRPIISGFHNFQSSKDNQVLPHKNLPLEDEFKASEHGYGQMQVAPQAARQAPSNVGRNATTAWFTNDSKAVPNGGNYASANKYERSSVIIGGSYANRFGVGRGRKENGENITAGDGTATPMKSSTRLNAPYACYE